jgi:polysaccharide pyruvyl transferase WcaK-like protein
MKVLLVGDVGGAEAYHAGDEATVDVAIDQLRQRGAVDLTVVSTDPTDIADRYGVDAVGGLGFASGQDSPSAAQRDRRLAAVLAAEAHPAELAPDDDHQALLDAFDGAEALVVTGGGSLSSTWPEHLYERVAALTLTQRHEVPSVVSGQTVGPHLTRRESVLLGEALSAARLVGLREQSSLRLATGLLAPTTPIRVQLDDALDLRDEPAAPFEGADRLAGGFVALTASPLALQPPHRSGDPDDDSRLDQLAELVRRVHRRTEQPVLFLPHVGRFDGEPVGDVAVGEALRRRLGNGLELVVAPLLPVRQLAGLTRQASAILSTRYHPIVFGLSNAVPCLGLYQDRYTASKLTGALDHAGLGDWRLPLEALATETAGDVFDELWARRYELRDHLGEITAGWADRQRDHWDELWQAISEPSTPVAARSVHLTAATRAGIAPKTPGAAALNTVASHQLDVSSDLEERWRTGFLETERYATDLGAAQRELESIRAGATAIIDEARAQAIGADFRRAAAEAGNIQLRDETSHAERSAAAARTLVGELQQDLDRTRFERDHAYREAADAVAAAEELQALVAAIEATKTMRWTRRPRRIYRRLRR